jgi:hypothetical protein
LTFNLVEKITVWSFATAIGSGLEPLDVKTDSQTRLDGLVSRIQIVKKNTNCIYDFFYGF